MNDFYLWLSGFLDGEGSFSIRFHVTEKYIKVSQCAIINMTIEDEPILKEIKRKLGYGYLKYVKATDKWKARLGDF